MCWVFVRKEGLPPAIGRVVPSNELHLLSTDLEPGEGRGKHWRPAISGPLVEPQSTCAVVGLPCYECLESPLRGSGRPCTSGQAQQSVPVRVLAGCPSPHPMTREALGCHAGYGRCGPTEAPCPKSAPQDPPAVQKGHVVMVVMCVFGGVSRHWRLMARHAGRCHMRSIHTLVMHTLSNTGLVPYPQLHRTFSG